MRNFQYSFKENWKYLLKNYQKILEKIEHYTKYGENNKLKYFEENMKFWKDFDKIVTKYSSNLRKTFKELEIKNKKN